MTTSDRPQVAPRHSEVLPAWVLFALVLTAQYLTVSYSVDARDLLIPAGMESVLGFIGDVAPWAFLFPAAVFLTGGATVRRRLRALSAYRGERGWSAVLGAVSLVLFVFVVALALRLKALGPVDMATARVLLSVWFGAVIASFATLVLALWSPRMIAEAVKGLRRELSLGFVVSGVAWTSGLLARRLWEPLAWMTLELVHAAITVLAPDPVASIEQSLVGTSRFYVEVAPVCSGMEGIALMVTFLGAYLYIQRRELLWPRSFVLIPLSALLVWLLNVVRVIGLIAVGTWYSPEVALGGFHSKAGWVFFALSALTVVFFIQRGHLFHAATIGAVNANGGSETTTAGPMPSVPELPTNYAALTSAYLAPMLAVIATKLLTGLMTSGFDYFYAVSVVAAVVALWRFRGLYPPLSVGSPWLALGAGFTVAAVWIAAFQEQGGLSSVPEGLKSLPSPLAGLWLATRALGSVITVPIVEELAFRGYLLRRFQSADFEAVSYRRFSWLGLIVSSVAFGSLHSQWQLGILAGLIFGLLTAARGRLSDAVLAHAAANLGVVAYAIASGQYALIA